MKVIVYKPKSCEYMFVADNLVWFPESGCLLFEHGGKTYRTKRPYAPCTLTDVYYDKQMSFESYMIEEVT